MRHRKSGVKLGRTSSHRKAMFRNMVTSLFKFESIHTTDAKAKELRKWADSMITLAKRGDLHARRQALAIIREKDVVHKLFEEASERFASISGGYTRITKIGLRSGDAAPMSVIELVAPTKSEKPKAKKKAAPSKAMDAKEAPKATEAAADESTAQVDEAKVVEEAPETVEAAPVVEAVDVTTDPEEVDKTPEDAASDSEEKKEE